MKVIVKKAKQGALDSATNSFTSMVSKSWMLLSHMNYKDCVNGKWEIIKLLVTYRRNSSPQTDKHSHVDSCHQEYMSTETKIRIFCHAQYN